MYPKLRRLAQALILQFEQIPAERKALLSKLAAYIQAKSDAQQPIRLVFICTHNARRSHFGQIAAAWAAAYYHLDQVETYSGGTEATAFHPNAIEALRGLGFEVASEDETVSNPLWEVSFGTKQTTTCFSKVYDHPMNPRTSFAAIMTCSDAAENCPVVLGAVLRLATTYRDPKAADGTPAQNETYQARFQQIATELFFAFSLVK